MKPFCLQLSLLVIGAWTVVQDVVQAQEAPVKVTVYYEALCPDSRHFITQNLHKALSSLPSLNVEYVPFGKANSNVNGEFDCQHGPDECKGNVVQSCALARLSPGQSQDAFVHCSMLYPKQYLRCVTQSGLSWTDVEACSESPEGNELQRTAEIQTKANTDGPTFVPSVAVNNVFNKSESAEAYADLESYLCKRMYAVSSKCSQKSYGLFF